MRYHDPNPEDNPPHEFILDVLCMLIFITFVPVVLGLVLICLVLIIPVGLYHVAVGAIEGTLNLVNPEGRRNVEPD
jgi:hypothetical protein